MATVYVAADHAGFELKEALKPFIEALGYAVEDCGASRLEDGDDYPDYVSPCAKRVANDPGSFGIIFGASGQGEAMAANRVPGVRAGVYYGEASRSQTDADGASLGLLASLRAHNDATILSLGARFMTEVEAKEAARIFLMTEFSGDERHLRRIGKF